jgi:hypothetical protein
MSFVPQAATINPGTTVTWTNNDSVTHTVTSDSGIFNSGSLAPGQSFSFTFPSAGTFTYHCTIHPYMTGSIVVTSASTNVSPSTGSVNAANPTSNLPGLPTTGAGGEAPFYLLVLLSSALLATVGIKLVRSN